jgi:methionyl-tRNA formyltransferase
VKRAAEERGLRAFTPERLRPFTDQLREVGADAFVVASYGKIVPQVLLDLVPIAFNVHPSLLPLYRGATPLQSAIRDGRTETGVTIIAMDAGMDTGDVLLQERTPIGATETYGELHDRLAQRGAELVMEALDRHANGTLQRKTQREVAGELGIADDEIARTLTRPLHKDDLEIRWGWSTDLILNSVRAFAPQPLARTEFFDEPFKIVNARATSHQELEAMLGPGASIAGSRRAHVGGNSRRAVLYGRSGDDELILIERVVPPNRGPMSGEDYARSILAKNPGAW